LKFTQRTLKPEHSKPNASTFQISAAKGTLSGKLQFTKPILNINYDSIFFRVDSLTTDTHSISRSNNRQHSITQLNIHKNFDKTLLPQKSPAAAPPQVSAKRDQKQKDPRALAKKIQNQLYIAPATFISVELDSSSRITQTIEPSTLETTWRHPCSNPNQGTPLHRSTPGQRQHHNPTKTG
jgi:hypothetical protein